MKKNIYAVHCRIKGGGALNVLEALIRKKTNSGQSVDVIFTLYSDRDYLEVVSFGEDTTKDLSYVDDRDSSLRSEGQRIPIVTALPRWINRIFSRVDRTKPRLLTYFLDYRNLMPFFPFLMRVLSRKLARRLQNQDADILISSYAVAKNIDVPEGIHKEIYFHQPMHYIRPLYEEYVGYMKGRKQRLYKKITPGLRKRDAYPRSYDIMYANSESTKTQIQDIYFLDKKVAIQVVHPPIEKDFFYESVVTTPDKYFFYINRLTKMFKHLDKIILLCNEFSLPLIIAGDGPDKIELMKIAGPTITFVGRVSDKQTKISLMKNSRGVLGIAHESFGIVTAEALLLGVPVFGYRGGATPELVEKEDGVLTPSLDRDTLSEYFTQFISQEYDRSDIQERARHRFDEQQEFWE